MKLKAKHNGIIYNVSSIDFDAGYIYLKDTSKSTVFNFKELITNVKLLEFSGVVLDGIEIYEGFSVYCEDEQKTFVVEKKPGGFFPFVLPVNKRFRYEAM